VKLADRLHNMRTLHFIKQAAKRERIARETLDIYAPLARSIGVHRICEELEELAFFHLNPVGRDAILRRLSVLRAEQGGAVAQVSQEMTARLEGAGVPARVYGREKQPFSIWRKLQRKSIGFSQLSDIYALPRDRRHRGRLLPRAGRHPPHLAVVPERFKDFISTPKRNNYRSLHTTVVGYRGMRIEMQIRTEAMDLVAEEGVAAHWRYKNKSYGFDAEAQKAAGGRDPLVNLRHLVQVLEHGGDAEELVEHAKLEMYLDQVFVFTPKGALVSLPRGAMPLDFAYALHTDIGDTTIGAKINGELKPLRTTLSNGDVVEVIKGGKPTVPPDWRSLTVTGRARSAIRRHIRQDRARGVHPPGPRHGRPDLRRRRKVAQGRQPASRMERFAVTTEDELFDARRPRPRHAQPGAGDRLPGPEGAEREAANARRHIQAGKTAKLYVRGSGLTPASPCTSASAARRCPATASSAFWRATAAG
jgi:GTP pyrophosphokinase/guanosine-3',5'-bis(diphosphate) 3'-pyrophosphohydrolase